MDSLVKDVLEQLKKTIHFLETLKVEKKSQKAERDVILKGLKSSARRCQEALSGKQADGETYDDLGPANGGRSQSSPDDVYDDVGDNYDDLGTTPDLPPPPDEGDGIYDDTGDETGMTYDDVVSGTATAVQQIAPVECESLTNPKIADFLELKKDAGLRILRKSPWQKRWCVVHSGIMYIYENAKDKKQKDAFRINAYKFKLSEDVKEGKRKERFFEMRSSEKAYEFRAGDKESAAKWTWALSGQNTGSLSDDHSGSIEDSYDDLGEPSKKKKGFSFGKNKAGKSKPPQNDDDGGDIYDEAGESLGQTYDDTANLNFDPAGMQTYDDTGNLNYDDTAMQTYDDTGITQEGEADDVYEDTSSTPAPRREQMPLPLTPMGGLPQRRASNKDALPPPPPTPGGPKPPGVPPALPPRDETGSASGTYLRNRPPMPRPGEAGGNSRELPHPPGKELPPSPSLSFPPPPPPTESEETEDDQESLDVFGDSKDDYDNMYQGMWDCTASEDNELRFKRGEIIHIISKEYDDYGWWTAESRHQEIGLVPVSYLMKAFAI